jgi:hypothetical protein
MPSNSTPQADARMCSSLSASVSGRARLGVDVGALERTIGGVMSESGE